MLDMAKFKTFLDHLTAQELHEAGEEIKSRFVAPTAPRFRNGDLIEFFSAKKHRMIRAYVTRVNAKTLSCHEEGSRELTWRVTPSLARLVGADKEPPTLKVPPPGVPATAPGMAAVPTAAGAGGW